MKEEKRERHRKKTRYASWNIPPTNVTCQSLLFHPPSQLLHDCACFLPVFQISGRQISWEENEFISPLPQHVYINYMTTVKSNPSLFYIKSVPVVCYLIISLTLISLIFIILQCLHSSTDHLLNNVAFTYKHVLSQVLYFYTDNLVEMTTVTTEVIFYFFLLQTWFHRFKMKHGQHSDI